MKPSGTYRWFEVALVAAILAMHAYAATSDAFNFPNAWFGRDDAYYYFKVAQNVTEGRGFTFDGINPTNGYHPLWLIVCIPIFALARYDLVLPLRLLLLLIAAMQAVTAVLLFRLVLRATNAPVAIVAASYWAFDTSLHYTFYEFGIETPLAILAVVFCLSLLSRREQGMPEGRTPRRGIVVLALAATAATFSRLDLIFFAAAVGLWSVLRPHVVRLLLPLDLLIFLATSTAAHAFVLGFPEYYAHAASAIAAAVLVAGIHIASFYGAGLYEPACIGSRAHLLLRSAAAVAIATVVTVLLTTALQSAGLLPGVSRQALVVAAALILILTVTLRLVRPQLGASGKGQDGPRVRDTLGTWLATALPYFGILGGAVGIYSTANRLAFGTWMPISAEIKRWWGTQIETIYEGPPRNMFGFFGVGLNSQPDAWQPLAGWLQSASDFFRLIFPGITLREERFTFTLVILFLLLGLLVLTKRRAARRAAVHLGLLPLFVGAGLQMLSYTALGYAGYKEWYWILQRILLLLIGALVLYLLAQLVHKSAAANAATWILSVAASILMAFGLGRAIWIKMPHGSSAAARPYMDVLPVLEAKTPSGSLIGMTGGGNVGYFIEDRTVVNMDGLINSAGYYRALREGRAADYLSDRGVTVVFANPGLLTLPPYNGQFAPYLERYDSYFGKALLWLLPEPKYLPSDQP